jgi:hypothetical protein
VIGPAETLDEYDIAFDVLSNTNRCAAADLVPAPGRRAWGVLYDIADDSIRGVFSDGRRTLASVEGPRYEEREIRVRRSDGQVVTAVTFLVRPGERQPGLWTGVWYVSWIVYGLRSHGVDEQYIGHVIEVALETNERAGDPGRQNELIRNL